MIIYQICVGRPDYTIQNVSKRVGEIPDFIRYMLFDPNI